jgi:hypothetical protein
MSTSLLSSILRGPSQSSQFSVVHNRDIHLPTEELAAPHHWKLKNLRHLLGIIARLQGFRTSSHYLEYESNSDHNLQKQVFYGLGSVLAGNCWDIQQAHQLTLKPVPPTDHSFFEMYMAGQNVPAVANTFTRHDGAGILSIRGTTTWRESLVDARSLWGYPVTLPLYGAPNSSRPPTFMSSIFAAFQEKDTKGHSMEMFVVQFVDLLKKQQSSVSEPRSIVISGHSLGGAFAQLAAYVAVQRGLKVVLTIFGPAQGSTQSFCAFMQDRGVSMYAVVNAEDYVPELHSLVSASSFCCPIVYLNAAADTQSIHSRLETHDPLYYGYALLAVGSIVPPPEVSCARTPKTPKSMSLPPSPNWKDMELNVNADESDED